MIEMRTDVDRMTRLFDDNKIHTSTYIINGLFLFSFYYILHTYDTHTCYFFIKRYESRYTIR